jgi:hypothetical protein
VFEDLFHELLIVDERDNSHKSKALRVMLPEYHSPTAVIYTPFQPHTGFYKQFPG